MRIIFSNQTGTATPPPPDRNSGTRISRNEPLTDFRIIILARTPVKSGDAFPTFFFPREFRKYAAREKP